MTEAAPMPARQEPLALVAGAGAFPLAAARTLQARGRDVFVLALKGLADPALTSFPHAVVRIGAFGAMVSAAQAAGCRETCLIGSLVRPSLLTIWPDLGALRILPRLLTAYRGGDDHLLRGLATVIEDYGFVLRGVQEIVPDLLAPAGVLGAHQPSAQDQADIALGLRLIDSLGAFDVGQATVVGDGHVVAVEGVEGTDGLLERVALMRQSGRLRWRGRTGLLVKAAKAGQDHRFDLPALGPVTVAKAHAAGLRGIAFRAGLTLMVDAEAVVRAADAAGMFVFGVETQT